MFWKAIFLGIIEGLTEFLPISSTGHLILTERILHGLSGNPNFSNAFDVIIQLGAIMAVVKLYGAMFWPFRKEFYSKVLPIWLKILVAFLPAAVLGFLYRTEIKTLFEPRIVAAALIFYGVLMIVLEFALRKRPAKTSVMSDIGWLTALALGFFQCLAMVPGTSRSAVTIIGGLLLGLSRTAAVEFSFFLAVPTMLGAAALTLYDTALSFTAAEWIMLIAAFYFAFWTALLVIQFFLRYLRKYNFVPFGIYRIILGLIVLWVLR
ncbi:MAG: undecaprenyl-diphosphate phosphatase [Candidatus Margulisbacteria bacterium]|jgi:undecaprenyl-diphosphatase|nr:undecaprenyl-diphosphate phosphatase [Candidatus Margulisiibacteriota bacterium]